MATANTRVEARILGGGICVLDVQGEVNSQAEGVLMDAYNAANAAGAKAIVLNMTGLEYMNSGGIGLLVTLLIRANRQNQKVLACGLSDHYRQIFELTRLSEAISLHATEEEALAAARAGLPRPAPNRAFA